MSLGLVNLPWWGYVLVTLALTHITIASVTIFLHRNQAHRALTLHPAVSHFFRFWLWLTTGMATREWVAIHRKHHATTDTPDDPHSPQIYGIRKVLFDGVDLYRTESGIPATIEKYGRGTPDDWIERRLYAKHGVLGLGIMLVVDLLFFGPIGLTLWAVQMLWIPLFAAGVINGIGHYWGYRNFAPDDASRNIVPWGVLVGGEELHNNHHAYTASARLSNRWWEFDIGWMYIRILEMLGLAKVNRVAPRVRYNTFKTHCDADTLRAVMTHRYDVLAKFARTLQRTALEEIRRLRTTAIPDIKDSRALAAVKLWLHRDVKRVPEKERAILEQALRSSTVLSTIDSMRKELIGVWGRTAASNEQMVKHLEDWCRRAEHSGIGALRDFSRNLRRYDALLGDMS